MSRNAPEPAEQAGVPARLRQFLKATAWTPISWIGVAWTATGPIFAGMTTGWGQAVLIVTTGIAALSASGVPTWAHFRYGRALTDAANNAALMRYTLTDAFQPIIMELGRIAATSSAVERKKLSQATIATILASAASVVGAKGPKRTRACWYKIDDTGEALVPAGFYGRSDAPKTQFRRGTPEGEAAFLMIENVEQDFVQDVRVSPPAGWDRSRDHEYTTFLRVPVVVGATSYGMLTVDALQPGDLSEADLKVAETFAALIAAVLAATDR